MGLGPIKSRRLLAASVAVLLLAGCARHAAPPAAPPLQVSLAAFNGSPISGPLGQAAAASPDQSLAVAVHLLALKQMPLDLQPIGPEVRLIAAPGSPDPMLSAARLTRGVRWAQNEQAEGFEAAQADQATLQRIQSIAIPPGTTWTLTLAQGSSPSDPRLQLLIHHLPSPGVVELAVGLDAPAEPSASPTPPRQRELAILQPQNVGSGRCLVLAVPLAFKNPPAQAIAAVIRLTPGSQQPEHAQAVADAAAELSRSADQVHQQQTPSSQRQALAAVASTWAGFESALTDLADPASRRRALAWLSAQTAAEICRDLALVADDPLLEQFTQQLATALGQDPSAPRTADALGWILDRTSLQLLLQLQSAEKLSPELSALLLRHAGQPAQAGTLEELLKQTDSRQALAQRLVSENYIHLEDSSPAARVRAFDWLSIRKLAPADYDPLGPPRQRRQAIEKALNNATSSNAGGQP